METLWKEGESKEAWRGIAVGRATGGFVSAALAKNVSRHEPRNNVTQTAWRNRRRELIVPWDTFFLFSYFPLFLFSSFPLLLYYSFILLLCFLWFLFRFVPRLSSHPWTALARRRTELGVFASRVPNMVKRHPDDEYRRPGPLIFTRVRPLRSKPIWLQTTIILRIVYKTSSPVTYVVFTPRGAIRTFR